jgi:hypothetical protein
MASLAILYDANALGAVDDNRVAGPAADLLRAQDKTAKAPRVECLHCGVTGGEHRLECIAWRP